ncbi:MAG: DUF1801 domain-containing protein [Pseudomonadota bacterium]
MAANKTGPTDLDPKGFVEQAEPARRRADALRLLDLFGAVTGYPAVVWDGGIVGFGRYDYTYKSGHGGTFLATGFAPRKASLSIYIMPGYADFGQILGRLGKHSTGVSCLYIKKLEDVDLKVLEELIRAGLDDLGQRWEIEPS